MLAKVAGLLYVGAVSLHSAAIHCGDQQAAAAAGTWMLEWDASMSRYISFPYSLRILSGFIILYRLPTSNKSCTHHAAVRQPMLRNPLRGSRALQLQQPSRDTTACR